jgi:predicted histidine transporter YuiF (NhaC family)
MNISIPAGVMFVGGLLLLFTSYIKLKNYRTEQPDENIK